jgi:DNA polymerase III subunit epsilon
VSWDENDGDDLDHQINADRYEAIRWSRECLANRDFLILDTETTGLQGAEVVSVSILSGHGLVLFDAIIKPQGSISAAASHVRHIQDQHTMLALSFTDVYTCLSKLLAGRRLVIYNAAFDLGILAREYERHQVPPIPYGPVSCAMEWYTQFVGEWNSYHGNYRWQKLPSGDHTSIGDCRATLKIIETMAAKRLPEDAPLKEHKE